MINIVIIFLCVLLIVANAFWVSQKWCRLILGILSIWGCSICVLHIGGKALTQHALFSYSRGISTVLSTLQATFKTGDYARLAKQFDLIHQEVGQGIETESRIHELETKMLNLE